MLRRFFAYYRPYRALFALDFGCAILAGLMELGFPMAIRTFVDQLLPSRDWGIILIASAGLLAVYLLNTALTGIVVYWGHLLGINIETEMRRRAFDHLQKLSFSFYDNSKTGNLITHVTKDLEDVGEVAHHGPEDLFLALMTFAGAFALMFAVNVKLALLTTIITPVVTIVSSRYGAKMTQNFRALFHQVGAFNARVEENVGGMRVVQAFANEEHERRLFAVDNARYRSTKLQAYRLMAASSSITYLGMRLTQMVVMIAGAWFVLHGELSEGGFVSFLLLVGVFLRPVDKINGVLESYPKGIAGFRRYTELLDTEPDIVDSPGAKPAGALRGDISFDGVTFGYGDGRVVLREVDLSVAAGETIAFVGPSGAGKTTLCSLLPRFYEPQAGRISIDGIDIQAMTLASLRGQIGIVQQDVFLFGGTMRENIAYGRLDAPEADILDAARRAQLDTVIASLPDGLDTVVGERGVKLSGGQKQRLAIARMFLKNPPILILDEATSALDTETERAVQRALAELAIGRTTLIIAHRLATIRNADRIVVVDAAGVVEQGRHGELLQARGAYHRLHAAQFGEAV
jgi:ATP-binding cassette subfamily B protein